MRRNLDIVSPIPINYICFSIYVLVSICWHKQHLCSVISYSCHTCCWTLTKQKILSQIRWSDVGHSVTDMMNVKIPRPTNRFPMSETQHNFFFRNIGAAWKISNNFCCWLFMFYLLHNISQQNCYEQWTEIIFTSHSLKFSLNCLKTVTKLKGNTLKNL